MPTCLALFEPWGGGEDWLRYFDINVMSGVRLSRHYFPRMLDRRAGRVIFVSSETGVAHAAERSGPRRSEFSVALRLEKLAGVSDRRSVVRPRNAKQVYQ